MSDNTCQFDLSARSTAASPRLTERICLRCAKQVADENPHDCLKVPNVRCPRCARMRKPCDQVPANRIPSLNLLLAARRDIHRQAPVDAAALAKLKVEVKEWTKSTEASVRMARKRGLRHKPSSNEEIGLLVLDQLKDLTNAVVAIVDTFREHHKMEPLGRRPGEGDFEEPSESSMSDGGDSPGEESMVPEPENEYEEVNDEESVVSEAGVESEWDGL